MQSRLACIVLKAGQAPRNLLASLASSNGQWDVPLLQSGGIDDEFISSSDRAEYWFERTRFRSACLNLQVWVEPGSRRKERSAWGVHNPSTSTWTLPTLTAVGEHLDEDESSFEDVFWRDRLNS